MKAYQVPSPGLPLELNEMETPKPSGTEVLVRTIACGLCHSDVHIHEGAFDLGNGNKLELPLPSPYTLGHEIFGEVVECGEDAKDVTVGEQAIVYPWIGCGACSICNSGDEHLCNAGQTIGVLKTGGFSDHVVVPHSKYLFKPTNVPAHLAGSYACSGLTAYSALKKGAPYHNNSMIIVGAGGVGMMGIQIAKAAYDINPIVVDVDQAKLDAALEQGASAAINPTHEDALMKIFELTGGEASAAIDFVGSEQSVAFGINTLAKGGKYIIVGLFGGELKVPLPMIPIMERKILGSYVGSPQDMKELMELVNAGKVDPIPVEQRPISEVNSALADLKDGKVLGRLSLIHD